MANKLILIAIGIVIGVITYHFFLKPEVEVKTVTETVTVTDTKYKQLYEELKMDVSTNKEFQNDSIDYYQDLYKKELQNVKLVVDTVFKDKPYFAPLQRFKGLKPSLYGDVSYNALVAGELLDLSLIVNQNIPEITNTITKEVKTTKTIIQKGLFAGGGMSNQLDYHVGLAYLGNGWMVNANYLPNPKNYQESVIQADLKINVFSIKK